MALTGVSPGTAVKSAAVGPVTVNAAPVASNVTVSGTTQIGQTLTGSYTYSDADGDLQGTSTFRWLRNNTAISGATATTYVLVNADQGATIQFEVTPVAQTGTSPGTAVKSTAVGPVKGVVFQQAVTGGSSSSRTVATASTLTAASSNIYLASISITGNVSVSSVAGLGLTWSLVKSQCGGRGQTRVEVWRSSGNPTASGTVTATLASTPSSAAIAVSRYSGVSAVGNSSSANTRGVSGACSGGTDSSSYTMNLTTTVANTQAYGATAIRANTHTPGAGYTERAEKIQSTGTTAAGTATEDKAIPTATTTAVNGTLSATTDWAVVGVELRP